MKKVTVKQLKDLLETWPDEQEWAGEIRWTTEPYGNPPQPLMQVCKVSFEMRMIGIKSGA